MLRVTIEADTIEEFRQALAALARDAGAVPARISAPAAPRKRTSASSGGLTYETVLEQFKTVGRSEDWSDAYRVLYESGETMITGDLAQALGKGARAGGSIRHAFKKAAESLGVPESDIVTVGYVRQNRNKRQTLKAVRFDETDGGEP